MGHPEIKLPGNKKGRLRKDRYSALLIANMVARTMSKTPSTKFYEPVGGFVLSDRGDGSEDSGKLYRGPNHLTDKMSGIYGMGVQKR